MYNESIVGTHLGPVRGRLVDGVHVFKGIRYGADTSAYRFLPPRQPESWGEVVNAFELGPSCPQDDPDPAVDRAVNPFLRKIVLAMKISALLGMPMAAGLFHRAILQSGAAATAPPHPGRLRPLGNQNP